MSEESQMIDEIGGQLVLLRNDLDGHTDRLEAAMLKLPDEPTLLMASVFPVLLQHCLLTLGDRVEPTSPQGFLLITMAWGWVGQIETVRRTLRQAAALAEQASKQAAAEAEKKTAGATQTIIDLRQGPASEAVENPMGSDPA